MPHFRVFPCPHCNEFIATDASSCRFCLTPIDSDKAQQAANAQDVENKRYMRSRYFRHMLTGGGLFLVGLVISLGSMYVAFNSPEGGYFLLTWGLVFAGAGDFLYGLVGVLGMIK